MIDKPITAVDIKACLHERHTKAEFGVYRSIGIDELHITNGRDDRFIDFWAIDCWQSKQFNKTAYEIKVSRSDWLSEMRKPQKRRLALFVSNLFYFIAPRGVIKVEELPVEAGLIEVSWTDNQREIDNYDKEMSLPNDKRSWLYRDHRPYGLSIGSI